MLIQVYDKPNIFKIEVPLPDNPLKILNAYVIGDKDEYLIVDTGFNRPECKAALTVGLNDFQVNWETTNMFLTHLHSDHTGLAPAIMEGKPGKIYMSQIDHEYLERTMKGDDWKTTDALYIKQGFTREQIEWLRYSNPAIAFRADNYFAAERVQDGDEIKVGDYTFTCVSVPGHTPGQMCLYCEQEEIMLTADHILFDITPNITFWTGIEDSLGDYLDSLVKIRKFRINVALPAHRNEGQDVYERIETIIHHHFIRLEETLDAVAENPGAHATKIGSCLKWSMRGKTWDEFPVSQRWFAIGETISHLDYLIKRGFITCTEGDEFYAYELVGDLADCKKALKLEWTRYDA